MVRPTLPTVSVAPMTATVLGEKNTSSGCVPSLMALRAGLLSSIIFMFAVWQLFAIGVGAEGGPVEGCHDVLAGNAVFARYGFDIAVVTTGAESEFLEDRYGFRVGLFDVADDHVVAD